MDVNQEVPNYPGRQMFGNDGSDPLKDEADHPPGYYDDRADRGDVDLGYGEQDRMGEEEEEEGMDEDDEDEDEEKEWDEAQEKLLQKDLDPDHPGIPRDKGAMEGARNAQAFQHPANRKLHPGMIEEARDTDYNYYDGEGDAGDLLDQNAHQVFDQELEEKPVLDHRTIAEGLKPLLGSTPAMAGMVGLRGSQIQGQLLSPTGTLSYAVILIPMLVLGYLLFRYIRKRRVVIRYKYLR